MSSREDAYPVCRAVGDRHLSLELGDGTSPVDNERVHLADRILSHLRPAGLRETVPAYAGLLVRFCPQEADQAALARLCLAVARAAMRVGGEDGRPESAAGQEVIVPVAYGGEWGPDLPEVARETGLDPEEVVARHSRGTYRVMMIGFAPGFPYLGGLDPSLAVPRLDHPRAVVPAGSVGLAGPQTGIYPHDLPGGWRIIGRTPLRLWRPHGTPACLLEPGSAVRFVDCGRGAPGWERAGQTLGEEPAEASSGVEEETGRPTAEVVVPGPLTTIQDAGRWGYARWGVPESGALDLTALREANVVLGNDAEAAGLEITYAGLRLRFTTRAEVALSLGSRASVDGRPVPSGSVLRVSRGAVLEVGRGRHARSYLAFRGGIAGPVIMGSRSTFTAAALGGIRGRALRTGDIIRVLASGRSLPWREGSARPTVGKLSPGREVPGTPLVGEDGPIEINVIPGPQERLFEAEVMAAFLSTVWKVSVSSDRRACVLEGTALMAPAGAGVSDGTPAGSVQVLPSGVPVILLADHQPTGGYPKIAVVATRDLPLLGRAWPGRLLRFVTETGGVREWRSDAQGEWRYLTLAGRRHLVSLAPASLSGTGGERAGNRRAR